MASNYVSPCGSVSPPSPCGSPYFTPPLSSTPYPSSRTSRRVRIPRSPCTPISPCSPCPSTCPRGSPSPCDVSQAYSSTEESTLRASPSRDTTLLAYQDETTLLQVPGSLYKTTLLQSPRTSFHTPVRRIQPLSPHTPVQPQCPYRRRDTPRPTPLELMSFSCPQSPYDLTSPERFPGESSTPLTLPDITLTPRDMWFRTDEGSYIDYLRREEGDMSTLVPSSPVRSPASPTFNSYITADGSYLDYLRREDDPTLVPSSPTFNSYITADGSYLDYLGREDDSTLVPSSPLLYPASPPLYSYAISQAPQPLTSTPRRRRISPLQFRSPATVRQQQLSSSFSEGSPTLIADTSLSPIGSIPSPSFYTRSPTDFQISSLNISPDEDSSYVSAVSSPPPRIPTPYPRRLFNSTQ